MNAVIATCTNYASLIASALEAEVQDSLQRKLNNDTHTLFNSIKAEPVLEWMGQSVFVGANVTAGGGAAFYGVFQEFGTGMHIENMAAALRGYFDGDGGLVPFNEERFNFPKGSGYYILYRSGPREGMIKSKGVPATHWFSEGIEAARSKIENIQDLLDAELQLLSLLDGLSFDLPL